MYECGVVGTGDSAKVIEVGRQEYDVSSLSAENRKIEADYERSGCDDLRVLTVECR